MDYLKDFFSKRYKVAEFGLSAEAGNVRMGWSQLGMISYGE
jgi:hypothetical protein